MTADMRAVSIAALQRELARSELEAETAQAAYEAAEQALATRKIYLDLVRRDLARLTGVVAGGSAR